MSDRLADSFRDGAVPLELLRQRAHTLRWGEQPPVAVANPIFVDIDGNGFKPNGDLLGGVLLGADPPVKN